MPRVKYIKRRRTNRIVVTHGSTEEGKTKKRVCGICGKRTTQELTKGGSWLCLNKEHPKIRARILRVATHNMRNRKTRQNK